MEDGGGLTARQTVIIPVDRNLNVPRFTGQLNFVVNISETSQLLDTIVNVTGTDGDQVTFSIKSHA